MRYYDLLSLMPWQRLPKRMAQHFLHGEVVSYSTLCAAVLVKLDEGLVSMGHLHRYLQERPALTWILGFPGLRNDQPATQREVVNCLPTARHLTRLLRQMPTVYGQLLLDATVALIADEVAARGLPFGDEISLDTKLILAWVRENNPKDSVTNRYDKKDQPKGDPDCRLGCKRRRNLAPADTPATPTAEGIPARTRSVAEFYWGYGSGVVATKIDKVAEVVLAELTQPFNRADISYFFPLMTETERRLGRKPRFGAFDAAFDAFYVHEYFLEAGGFAAVPWASRADHRKTFNEEGVPLCAAGLAMPRRSTFLKKSHSLFPHPCVRYACPLKFPEDTGQPCPIEHKNWHKKGCVTTLPDSPGVRIRHELDRKSDAYLALYQQRTATERVNSQAVALGIERPKLRNGHAIANFNTLTYVLINLRTLHRLRQSKMIHLRTS
jgi:hypothetical protein